MLPASPRRSGCSVLAAIQALDPADSRTGSDGFFDRSARLAGALFDGAPTTLTLVDSDILHHVGAANLAQRPPQEPLAGTLVSHVLSTGEALWLADVGADPVFARMLTGCASPVVFFTGVPICCDGEAIGALCVWSDGPRAFDPALAERLRDLTDLVSETMATRLARHDLALALAAKREADRIAYAYLDHAPCALAMLDTEMRFLSVSARYVRDFQIPADRMIGVNHYEVQPLARRYEAVHRRAMDGETVCGEATFIRPDGTERNSRYEVAPWRMPDGEIGGIIIASTEIKEAVQSRRAAEASERRLGLALEMSGTGVWEADITAKRIFATGPAMELFPLSGDFARLNENIWSLCHEADRPWLGRAWMQHLATGAPFNVEHRVHREGDEVSWVHSVVEAVRGPDGVITKVIGVLRDVTARKQSELQLAEAMRDADASNHAKSEFLANMSHELRTPLNGITGVTGALLRTHLDARQSEMVGLIETSAEALARLLSDVLDLARVESGGLELASEPYDLEGLVRGVGTLFQWRAQQKGVDFRCELEPSARGRYRGDEVRLRQILSNLLSNAVKFTAAGEVSLQASFDAKQGALRFVVTDTGIGFTPDQAARLFDRFSQADGSITRRFGGSGLGLSISRALAEKMGGSLEATGIYGEGATFTLSLPAALDTTKAPAPDAIFSTARSLAGKVLLAEDHPINRKVVELILGSAGVQITSVENGEEALSALKRERFDVVLMDMQMPVMDGLTATRALRAEEARLGLRRTPVVALTANALPEHARASREAGADEHMTKPVAAGLLLGVVARLIGEGAQPPETRDRQSV